MTILARYWIRSFLRFFLIIQTIVLSIFVSVDYLTNIDKIMKSGLSFTSGFGYVILKIPFMFVELTPASTVLSVITVFSLMNRNNELLAIRAGGISTRTIVTPAIIIGIVLSLMMLFLGETVVPSTMSKANYIKYSLIKKNRNVYAVRENVWIKGDNSISHFNFFNPVDQTISGINITFFDKKFKITERIDAENGKFINGKWILTGVLSQTLDKSTNEFLIRHYEQKEMALELDPEDLKAVVKKSDEMDFRELYAHIEKIQSEGFDATTYKVDLFGKIAFPFICVIMSIFGASIGMRRFARENLTLCIAAGVVISFCYWIVYGFSTSLGYARILPPFVSAWATNFIFLSIAVIYYLGTE